MLRRVTRIFLILFLSAASSIASERAPTYAEMARASYSGVADLAVTLIDGEWEGPPYVDGGAARPRVGLMKNFIESGELVGANGAAAAVVVWHSSGGSGTFNHVAVGYFRDDGTVHTLTAPLGDRVKPRQAKFSDGGLELEVLQHDEDDPACCPTEIAVRRWRVEGDRLVELDS